MVLYPGALRGPPPALAFDGGGAPLASRPLVALPSCRFRLARGPPTAVRPASLHFVPPSPAAIVASRSGRRHRRVRRCRPTRGTRRDRAHTISAPSGPLARGRISNAAAASRPCPMFPATVAACVPDRTSRTRSRRRTPRCRSRSQKLGSPSPSSALSSSFSQTCASGPRCPSLAPSAAAGPPRRVRDVSSRRRRPRRNFPSPSLFGEARYGRQVAAGLSRIMPRPSGSPACF